jgi:tetratricopeptide (TPR) repeat protein
MPGERAVSGSRSIPMSLTVFQFEVKRCWKKLKQDVSALADAYLLFAGGKEIWPDQCKNALALLYKIENPVRELRDILENPTNLPASVAQQRHLLLMAIQHADEQIRVLITHIAEFRTLCQIESKQTLNLRQEIVHELSILVKECDEVVNNIGLLLDQTRFQERKTSEFQSAEVSRESHFYEQKGHDYNEQGEKDCALEYLEEALRLVQKLGDCNREGRVLNDLAEVYSSSGRQDEALDCLEKALEIVREAGDRRLEGQILNNLGLVFNDLGWLEEAKAYLEAALSLMSEMADHLHEGRIQRFKVHPVELYYRLKK